MKCGYLLFTEGKSFLSFSENFVFQGMCSLMYAWRLGTLKSVILGHELYSKLTFSRLRALSWTVWTLLTLLLFSPSDERGREHSTCPTHKGPGDGQGEAVDLVRKNKIPRRAKGETIISCETQTGTQVLRSHT